MKILDEIRSRLRFKELFSCSFLVVAGFDIEYHGLEVFAELCSKFGFDHMDKLSFPLHRVDRVEVVVEKSFTKQQREVIQVFVFLVETAHESHHVI